MFEVALCKVKNKAEMVKMFILLNNMDAKDVPGITYYRTDNIEIILPIIFNINKCSTILNLEY